MRASSSLLSLFAVALVGACSSGSDGPRGEPAPTGSGGDGIGSGAGAGGISAGSSSGASLGAGGSTALIGGTAGASGRSSDPEKCGEHHFDLERKPAEILLLLDRSSSMKDLPDGAPSGSQVKWDLVEPAIKQVITDTNSAVSWGMKVFPEGTGAACVASGVTSAIDVPILAMNAAKVTAALGLTTPEGNGTPTADAESVAVKYLQSLTDTNPKYILLATDGEPSCPKPVDAARTAAKQAVAAAAAAGIHTFVVGVATTKTTATAALNDMAIAGMEARDDPNPVANKFYLANTEVDLVTALKVITGQVSGCIFTWTDVPPVPDNIAVKVGGVKAPHDATDGWEYTGSDYKGVEVHGSWCDKIKTTAANMVEIIYGCPGVVIN